MNFGHKLSTIQYNNNSNKELWKLSKFLKNRNKQLPPLKVGGQTLLTSLEKSNALASQFAENHQNPLASNNVSHTNYIENSVNRFIRNCTENEEELELTTLNEVTQIVSQLKNTKAPGFDEIQSTLIKHLPPIGFIIMTLIFNSCLTLSYFPKIWKLAKVISIRKPGKPPSAPTSYRPISLLSILSKILERIILVRLKNHLQDNNIIPEVQHGFRENRSTVTQLNRLTNHIKNGLTNKLSTGLILLDIEKAFDRVWHKGLLFKLITTNAPKYIIKIIRSFLESRSFQVVVQGSKSATHNINFGVPQGSVLSPTLYSIYTYDLPVNTHCSIALFADDTALFSSSRFAKTIIKALEKTAKELQRYFNKWKIKLNESKTQAIFFTRRRTKQIPRRPFHMNNADVEWEASTVKYLGLVLDKRLTFKNHTELAISKATKAFRILYSLFNRQSKLNVYCKVLLYKVTIRPILMYAAPVMNQIAVLHKKKLQVMQNKILRTILNVPWHTSTKSIHEETQMEIITDFMNKLTTKFQSKYEELFS